MAFSKSFPKTLKNSSYPTWEEVYLSDDEEKEVEKISKEDNIKLMKECIDEAKKILDEKGLKDSQSDVVNVAVNLFNKIASHQVHNKDNKAKEKFDEKFKSM